MSKLKAVPPKAAAPSRPKILIYGKPGVGKTWAALDFPSVYYIDTEGGADLGHYVAKLEASGGVYLGPEQGSQSLDTIIEQVKALATEKHDYRTLVIDSISKAFQVEIAQEAERLGDKDQYGASKKPAVSKMRQLVVWLGKLDMNAILIAHAKDEYGLDNKGNREVIGETFDAWDKLEYELHLCLNIIKAGPKRVARVRKSRLLGFPDADTMPWSYDEFAKRFGRELLEASAKSIEIASPEQVAEVNRLLEIVKLPDGQIDKWLAAAGVTDWAEMEADKITKAIAAIKSKIAA
ncbi:AAA family ATPase [Roseomonas gilardii]|uniref:AAA family ATPase n=1 Tax=Roseomonas gilardii TaxID=257708 RepID=A0ABU3MKY9_9PROT|nr:AAA family ATPase [Roseomonas gilardii]MDT8333029.1 AAA family ATPase [Roseomonas gilardii]